MAKRKQPAKRIGKRKSVLKSASRSLKTASKSKTVAKKKKTVAKKKKAAPKRGGKVARVAAFPQFR